MTAPTGVPAADVIAYARTQLGDPYWFGATGPDRWDCSGILQWAYKQAGLSIPRVTYDMVADPKLQRITRGELQPGDLVFSAWGADGGKRSSHVGMYIGNNQLIQSGSGQPIEGTSHGVQVTALDANYWAHVDELRRVPGVLGYAGPSDPDGPGLLFPNTAVGNALSLLQNMVPNPGNVTEALTNIGSGVLSVAQSAIGVGQLAGTITRAFLPTNLLRGFFFFMGIVFILLGIWFVSLELRD